MSEWRDISSAPTDGRPVDLWAAGPWSDVQFFCGSTARAVGGGGQGRVTDCVWKDGAWRVLTGLEPGIKLPMSPMYWAEPDPPATD